MAKDSELASIAALVARLESTLQRLEALEDGLDLCCCDGSSNEKHLTVDEVHDLQASAEVAASISAFDALVDSRVKPIMVVAGKIGGEVLELSNLLVDAFAAEKRIIEAISKCKQPDDATLQKLIQPLADVIVKANALTERRRTDAYNHAKTLADSLQALTWVAYKPDCGMSPPGTHVEESWQAAEFYSNKVLIQHRNSNSDHVEWAKSMKELYLSGLKDYVLKFHIKGPSWNIDGIDMAGFIGTGVSSIPAASTEVPPHSEALYQATIPPAFEEFAKVAKPALAPIPLPEFAFLTPQRIASESKASLDMPFHEFKKEEASIPGILSSDSSDPLGERGEEQTNGHSTEASTNFQNLREHQLSADRSRRSSRVLWETKTMNPTKVQHSWKT